VILRASVGLVYAFLLLPMVIVVLAAFNAGTTRATSKPSNAFTTARLAIVTQEEATCSCFLHEGIND
jgi:ABC-type spermidine/putrescine transport system permease subunit II